MAPPRPPAAAEEDEQDDDSDSSGRTAVAQDDAAAVAAVEAAAEADAVAEREAAAEAARAEQLKAAKKAVKEDSFFVAALQEAVEKAGALATAPRRPPTKPDSAPAPKSSTAPCSFTRRWTSGAAVRGDGHDAAPGMPSRQPRRRRR